MRRRSFLHMAVVSSAAAVLVSKGLLIPREAIAAWPEAAFKTKSLQDATTKLLGSNKTTPGEFINIDLGKITENGANVPITVSVDGLENVRSINIFSEKNPIPLLANFEMTNRVATRLTTRIRLAETTNVVVIVKANGWLYSAKKKIMVTIGGCGV